jgi:serine/alanine adding enzyme
MFEVFSHTRGCSPELWAAVDSDEEILALFLPIKITVLNGLLRPFTTRAVAYGSVLCAPHRQGQEALARVLHTYNQETKGQTLFTELRNLSDMDELQPILQQHGFEYADHLNYLIGLNRPITKIWQSIRPNARRNIQKARKLDVRIEEVNSKSGISVVYPILKQVYKRIQVPLPDVSLFQSVFEVLHPQRMLRIFLAKVNDIEIGVIILLIYKGVITYWYTGTLREYSSYRAGDLLVWNTLELGNQNGFQIFDFGGGGRPEEKYGVRDFKAKFGGCLVNYGRNTCVHAPIRLMLSQRGYDLMRRFL